MTYPNSVLNLRVDQKYANDQYQDLKDVEVFDNAAAKGTKQTNDIENLFSIDDTQNKL